MISPLSSIDRKSMVPLFSCYRSHAVEKSIIKACSSIDIFTTTLNLVLTDLQISDIEGFPALRW